MILLILLFSVVTNTFSQSVTIFSKYTFYEKGNQPSLTVEKPVTLKIEGSTVTLIKGTNKTFIYLEPSSISEDKTKNNEKIVCWLGYFSSGNECFLCLFVESGAVAISDKQTNDILFLQK